MPVRTKPRYERLKDVFLKEALSGANRPDDLVWNDSLFKGLVDDYLGAKDEDDRLTALHSLSSLLYIAADDAHRVADSKIEFLLRRVGNLNHPEKPEKAQKNNSDARRPGLSPKR